MCWLSRSETGDTAAHAHWARSEYLTGRVRQMIDSAKDLLLLLLLLLLLPLPFSPSPPSLSFLASNWISRRPLDPDPFACPPPQPP